MKFNVFIGCLALVSFLFGSCEREGVTMYEESPTVYFGESYRSYTFVENMDRIKIGFDTIKLPLQISGSAVDRVREVVMEAVLDTRQKPICLVLGKAVSKQTNTKGIFLFG